MSSKVIVVGSSGCIGKATLAALAARHADMLATSAGVRSPDKLAAMDKVTAVKADMGDKAALAATLKGCDAAFLVVLGHEKRTELGSNAIDAAKEAGVKFIVVLSVLTSGADSVFGKQLDPIEEKTKESGVEHAIVRLPLFMDNNHAHAGSVKDQGTFCDPRDPAKPHAPVAVGDVGKAVADVMADPSKHDGKTCKLVSPPFTLDDMAAAFTKTLGKEAKATTVPHGAVKEAFMGMGFPEWQTDGILELHKCIDEDSPITNEAEIGDIEAITGEKPMTIESWVEANAAGFKQEQSLCKMSSSTWNFLTLLARCFQFHVTFAQGSVVMGERRSCRRAEVRGRQIFSTEHILKLALLNTLRVCCEKGLLLALHRRHSG